MKKIYVSCLVLASIAAAAQAGQKNGLEQLARVAVFQTSRFFAGACVQAGVSDFFPIIEKHLPSILTRDNNMKGFVRLATAGLAPQIVNDLTNSIMPGALSWLKPVNGDENAGRYAFWAGMVMSWPVRWQVMNLGRWKR